jgi:hypothetical protein
MIEKFLLVPLSDFAKVEIEIKCPRHFARVGSAAKFESEPIICSDCNSAGDGRPHQYLMQVRESIKWLEENKWKVSLRMPLP